GVEPAVQRRGKLATPDAAGAVDRAGVEQLDADVMQEFPPFRISPGVEDRVPGARDDRAAVVEQPDRRLPDGLAWLGRAVGMTPLGPVAGDGRRLNAGLGEQRMLLQPTDVGGIRTLFRSGPRRLRLLGGRRRGPLTTHAGKDQAGDGDQLPGPGAP